MREISYVNGVRQNLNFNIFGLNVYISYSNIFYPEERHDKCNFQVLNFVKISHELKGWLNSLQSTQSKLLMNKYFIEGTQTSFNELQ